MNLVIAIRSKRKRDSEKWVTPLIERCLRVVPYSGDVLALAKWHSEDNRTVLLSFAHAEEPAGPEPRIVEWSGRHDVVASLSGRTHIGLTQGLADGLIGPDRELHHQIPHLGGYAAVVMVDRREDRLIAANSISCLNPLYWAENEELFVVGSWATAVHLIESQRDLPDYDVQNLVSFMNCGFHFDDVTPYRNVQVLPPISTIVVGRSGTTVESTDLSALVDRRESAASDEFYDDLAEAFLDCFRPLKALSEPLNLGLTGGKDSRLLLAGLLGAGVPVAAHTHSRGSANYSDVEAAKMVAKAAGIHDHEIRGAAAQKKVPASRQVDLPKRTCSVLRLTDGMMYGYENIPDPPRYRKEIVFAGVGGELLRGGGYVKFVKKADRTTILRRLDLIFTYKDFLTREQQRRLESTYNSLARPGGRKIDPAATLDLLFLRYRTGRNSSVGVVGSALMQNAIFPLFDNGLISRIYANTTIKERKKERVVFNILQRVSPQLAKIPFAHAHWGFHSERKQKKTMERYPECFMKPEALRGTVNTDWRTYVGRDLKEVVMDQVLGCQQSAALFDVIDRQKIEALMASEEYGERRYMNLAFALYSASMLLSNAWLTDPVPSRLAEVVYS